MQKLKTKTQKEGADSTLSDCRQSDFQAAEGFGKQSRFPSGIRRQNSLLSRKTAGFKAFCGWNPSIFSSVSTRRNPDFDEGC